MRWWVAIGAVAIFFAVTFTAFTALDRCHPQRRRRILEERTKW